MSLTLQSRYLAASFDDQDDQDDLAMGDLEMDNLYQGRSRGRRVHASFRRARTRFQTENWGRIKP